MSKNPVCTWDFTLKEEGTTSDAIIKTLKSYCKEYCFQLEEGASGYMHFQGRFSLKVKARKPPFETGHYSPTSKANLDNNFYVTKEDTRVKGPWTSKDPYVPRQIRELPALYPWQQQVIDSKDTWDTRHINVVYCKTGNIGKSSLVSYMRAHKIGRPLPPCNDYKDMLRIVFALAEESNNCFLIDQPRSMKKDKLFGFYSAIETIKDGYAYDDRYSFQEKVFDCPIIWVFTNIVPDMRMLSYDRWMVWEVDNENVLQPLTIDYNDSGED